MTFDARKGASPVIGKNALFAAAMFAVVGGAFLIVLNFPAPGRAAPQARTSEPRIATATTRPAKTSAAFSSKAARQYFETLRRVDPAASATLEKRLETASASAADARAEIVFDHAAGILRNRAEDLAQADTHHVDALLMLTRDRLKAASHSGNAWCKGSRYAGLDQASLTDEAALRRELKVLEAPLRDYGFEVMTGLLLAIEDARIHPVPHGPLTPTDKAALQGVMMSMVSDPQVMPLLMASQSGTQTDELRNALNVCELGATAMTALKTLPQDTKGRAFADLIQQMELGGSDLAGLTRF